MPKVLKPSAKKLDKMKHVQNKNSYGFSTFRNDSGSIDRQKAAKQMVDRLRKR